MYSYNPYYDKYLAHYGTPRHSGRYPWGSGKRPHQHDGLGSKSSSKKESAAIMVLASIYGAAYFAALTSPLWGPYLEKKKQQSAARKDEKLMKEFNEPHEIDKESGLPLKNKKYSEKQDLELVNPSLKAYGEFSSHNCANCSIIYDLRKRGFDVTANLRDTGLYSDTIKNMYKDTKINNVSKTIRSWEKYDKKVLDTMNKEPEGSRGICMIDWEMGGGHAYNYEIKNGKVRFIDAQQNSSGLSVKLYLSSVKNGSFEYIRTDDKQLNYKNLSKYKVTRDTTKSIEDIVNSDIVVDKNSNKSNKNSK